MEWRNSLTDLLQVAYPLMQAPMLHIATPAMVAAVSNAGALGSLPVGGQSPERVRTLIREVKSHTAKPFAVNLFAHPHPGQVDPAQGARMHRVLRLIGEGYQLEWEQPALENLPIFLAQDQIPVLLEEKVPVVSFTFGVLEPQVLDAFRKAGVVTMGTATCLDEALRLQEQGVSAVIAQGTEAGGHRGAFLNPEAPPQIGLAALVRGIVRAVRVPVIAAGGIMDGAGLAAAFALGAQGVQLGSAFLRCPESAAPPAYKAAVATSQDQSTVLTKAFTGRWGRAIRNEFTRQMAPHEALVLPYPVQEVLTRALREKVGPEDVAKVFPLWAGQAAYLARELPASQIVAAVLQEAEAILWPDFQ
ncbi:NAD(P)H-dependent flavin oxidoreductase [Rufibacter psychrotolerans]|uniref:NAD(P)H-dependent flavin oxidoreductase n=1 Tax=Rufibacter psychrotolerans TaxID=2812556 RepID=UPI0019680E77|nr:nitronate monooxygenase [Rufibacter sp. SYSU D00308]